MIGRRFEQRRLFAGQLRHLLARALQPPLRKNPAMAERSRRLEAEQHQASVVVCPGNLREASCQRSHAECIETGAIALRKLDMIGDPAQAPRGELFQVDGRVAQREPRTTDRGPDRHEPRGDDEVLRLVARSSQLSRTRRAALPFPYRFLRMGGAGLEPATSCV